MRPAKSLKLAAPEEGERAQQSKALENVARLAEASQRTMDQDKHRDMLHATPKTDPEHVKQLERFGFHPAGYRKSSAKGSAKG